MDKNKQATDGATTPAKGAAPKQPEKAPAPAASTKDGGGQKPDAKADKATHGAAHPAKK